MQARIVRRRSSALSDLFLICLLPINLLLWCGLAAAQTAAQGAITSQRSSSPRLRGTEGRVHESSQHGSQQEADATSWVYIDLYTFCASGTCTDGENPDGGLIQDAAGNFYGTTNQGGAAGLGTVFKLDGSGKETVLYSFTGVPDGGNPHAGLIADMEGNLYGTTYAGGAGDHCNSGVGCGTVFEIDATGHETVLYSFCSEGGQNCTDGQVPQAGVIRDGAGNLYGTTRIGGANSGGTVFKLDSAGHETVLYSFCSVANCADGSNPVAGLIQDADGNLYGASEGGGAHGGGTVFKLDSSGHETVLYSFCSEGGKNCTDGNSPGASLIRDGSGSLYGTTISGGANNQGTVFKLDATGEETVLFSFDKGGYPLGTLILDDAGNLYGTTVYDEGSGTVFEIDTTGQYSLLYAFDAPFDSNPSAGVIRNAAGTLYGTVPRSLYGGAVFKLAPAAVVTLSSSVNPSYVNQAVTFSVVATGIHGTPTGSVTFYFLGGRLGPVQLVNGQASGTTTFKKAGYPSVWANYSGDQGYAPGDSNQITQQILKQYLTSTTLASGPNPSTYGQAVTLTATVTSAGPTPTGTVTFKNKSMSIGSATVSGGVATLTVSTLPAGTLSLKATYSGDAANKTSTSAILTQTVNPASSTTALVASPDPSKAGQTVKFTATVSSTAGVPTGTVAFLDGSTTLGTATLAKGKAIYRTATLSQGSHNITAVYQGSADFIGSTSGVVVQTVN
jgi:uncharacterized repeat protein (TIGR03803 family)